MFCFAGDVLITIIKKYALSIIAMLLIGLFFVKENVILKSATKYTSDIAKDSAAVYLSLRGINAALSFVEEIEVNASVVVASGSVQPFKVLEPIDDAVERMSSAIFYIGVMAATTTVVLEFFGRYGFLLFGITLGVQQLVFHTGLWGSDNIFSRIIAGIRNSAGIILIALISFFISSTLSDKLSDNKWLEYRQLLNEISGELDDLSVIDQMEIDEKREQHSDELPSSNTPENNEKKSWAERTLEKANTLKDDMVSKGKEVAKSVSNVTNGTMNTMVEKYNLAGEITSKFWERKDELVEALTGIFALFIFKTFILPMLLFLFFYGSFRGTLYVNRT